MKKIITLISLVSVVAISSGCSNVDVKPWQKGTLAKEHMALEPDALQRIINEQVVTSKESSSGGYGVVGGGCGCN